MIIHALNSCCCKPFQIVPAFFVWKARNSLHRAMASSRTGAFFEAPDVRARSIETVKKEDDCPPYWLLHPGLNYQGVCPNAQCASQGRGKTINSKEFGEFRPNEQFLERQIVCLACKSRFRPRTYFFYNCSAKVTYCIVGGQPEEASLSESREDRARVLGQAGRILNYEMLRIEVRQPGHFPDQWLDANANLLNNQEMMNPQNIFFTQAQISLFFKIGRGVVSTLVELESGELLASAFPPIRVFMWNGRWHSADNRRLWCFKQAGLTAVPVTRINIKSVDRRKFTTTNNGESVTFF